MRIGSLKVTVTKKVLMAQVFAASENEVQHVKTVVEIESNLITDYKNKLKIGDILIPDPFNIPHGWMEKNEGMIFWSMLSYPGTFSFLVFYPSELGSKKT